MIYLIIGHRGVGKTLWLKKIKKIFKESFLSDSKRRKNYFIDLDEEIEKETGKIIKEFFLHSKEDEKYFRRVEKNTLDKLIDKYKAADGWVFIAVGAGFNSRDTIPSFCQVIHLIRETDFQGRVFLYRPRLRRDKNPYQEYISLYSEREKFYREIKTESFVLPEQDFEFEEPEKLLYSDCLGFSVTSAEWKKDSLRAIITLNKSSLPACSKKWRDFIHKRLSWGVGFFELRDDQLSSGDLNFLRKIIPKKKQLLSFRKSKRSCFFKQDLSSLVWDWPLEKGLLPLSSKTFVSTPSSFRSLKVKSGGGVQNRGKSSSLKSPILSLHTRTIESFEQLCEKLLQHKAGHFKLSVPVKNFKELWQGHLWFLEDPEHRSFLPVSEKEQKREGLWRWYRQIFGPLMKLHFIRESRSGLSDQSFLYEHLVSLSIKKNYHTLFAAVLGDPVTHSASPAFHRKFFAQQKLFGQEGMIFTKMTMNEEELTKENLCILQKMGLVFAALTSPLKKKAFQICDKVDSSALSVESVNTLVFKNQKWVGSSTDQYGLQALLMHAERTVRMNKRPYTETKEEMTKRTERRGINEDKACHLALCNEKKERNLGKSFKKGFNNKGDKIVVWGGGGMKKILEKELLFADFYSARTGLLMIRETKEKAAVSEEEVFYEEKLATHSDKNFIVIWAVGRNRMPCCRFPPASWKPQWVVDLNYTEDSPGLEYALLSGAQYISGKIMFKHQAKKQQQYFLAIY